MPMSRFTNTRKILAACMIFLILSACTTSRVGKSQGNSGKTRMNAGNPVPKPVIKIYSVTHNNSENIAMRENGYGYDIFLDGKRYIHQPVIPGISGNVPFNSRKDAKKTAKAVVGKIEKKILPPSLTQSELDSLGVVH
jgi:hypothetical protein